MARPIPFLRLLPLLLLIAVPQAYADALDDILELLVTTFHEIRGGKTTEGVKVDRASSVMSTAEAVAVGFSSTLYAGFFASGEVTPAKPVNCSAT